MIGLATLLQVTLLVALGLAAVAAMRHRSAAARHWVLTSMLCAALATPVLARVMPRWPIPRFSVSREAAVTTGPAAADVNRTTVATNEAFAFPFAASPADAARTAPIALAWLAAVWVAGVAVMGVVLAAGILRLWWLAGRARTLRDGPWHDAVQALLQEYRMRPVTLLHSQHPTLLVTWGLWRPRIILPAPAVTWSAARLRVVLRHELAHIRRGDWAAQLVAEAVRALHWYNPLVWMACRRLRDESELACDAALMREGLSGLDYASELLELARVLQARRDPWTTALAMARPSSLERRVTAMLTEQLDRTPMERRSRALAVCAAVALAVALAGFTAAAQSFSTVSGTVVDQLGGSLPRVTLTLVSAESDRKYEVRADATGLYQFVGIVPGQYTLKAWLPGFKNTGEALLVTGQTVRHNLTMPVGSLEETISLVHRAGEAAASPGAARPATPFVPEATTCTETSAGGVITQPTKIKDVRPVYPENLGDAQRSEVLVFNAIIARDGTIREVTPKDDNGQIDLTNAAIAAVRQWRYTPTLLNCVPIEVEMTVTVHFSAE